MSTATASGQSVSMASSRSPGTKTSPEA